MACSFLCFLSLFSLLLPISSITIPLSHFHPNPSHNPYQHLNRLVSSSLTRAHHLKYPQTTATATTETPLFSHSYGGYSISLSFGTPPQTLPFVMDTGSNIVWFPCTHRYICSNCTSFFPKENPPRIPTFIPRLSSSSKILGCLNPKCSWIHPMNLQCKDCNPKSTNCTQICPPYLIVYGSGTTGGLALSETLDFPKRTFPNFLVGCSVFSSSLPAGIAGFGRGLPSLPAQLGIVKFSYCLLSRRFDDAEKSSSLVLDSDSDSGEKTTGVTYTPFIQNPKVAGKHAFSVYYYVGLRRITVGERRVKIPYRYLSPGNDGSGGTVIDSGTTFTFMARDVFEPLAAEFVAQVKNYTRAHDIEGLTGLRPCFNVSHETVSFPELSLHFKGGAEVALPLENYFAFIGDGGTVCLTVVTDGVAGEKTVDGPAIILGSFQMQNYYVEYDLRNERLGFKQQTCK